MNISTGHEYNNIINDHIDYMNLFADYINVNKYITELFIDCNFNQGTPIRLNVNININYKKKPILYGRILNPRRITEINSENRKNAEVQEILTGFIDISYIYHSNKLLVNPDIILLTSGNIEPYNIYMPHCVTPFYVCNTSSNNIKLYNTYGITILNYLKNFFTYLRNNVYVSGIKNNKKLTYYHYYYIYCKFFTNIKQMVNIKRHSIQNYLNIVENKDLMKKIKQYLKKRKIEDEKSFIYQLYYNDLNKFRDFIFSEITAHHQDMHPDFEEYYEYRDKYITKLQKKKYYKIENDPINNKETIIEDINELDDIEYLTSKKMKIYKDYIYILRYNGEYDINTDVFPNDKDFSGNDNLSD